VIAIVDYGMGNRRSVEKALERVGAETTITRDHDELRGADGVVLPGVGAFPAAMEVIAELELDAVLVDIAERGTPLFGSCMGMQLLFESSEEQGGAAGLGILPGVVKRLDAGGQNLPHIGWSEVSIERESPLTDEVPADEEIVLGEAEYGERFAAVVGSGNVFGAQSHPEKSSAHGLSLLRNFVGLCA
jgi:glutamine amidotransferase